MITSLAGKFFLTSIGKALPPWLWEIIAVALLIAGLTLWHHGRVVSHDNGVRAEQKTADDKAFAAKTAKVAQEAYAIRVKTETLGSSISSKERTNYEETLRSHAADAGALLVRGPGASASHCGPVDHSGAGSGAGGYVGSAAQPDDAGSALPSEEWATVPWSWLDQRAQEHDDLLSEVKTWRENDAKQRAAWDSMRAAPAPGTPPTASQSSK